MNFCEFAFSEWEVSNLAFSELRVAGVAQVQLARIPFLQKTPGLNAL
jgi:hypothetical protein